MGCTRCLDSWPPENDAIPEKFNPPQGHSNFSGMTQRVIVLPQSNGFSGTVARATEISRI